MGKQFKPGEVSSLVQEVMVRHAGVMVTTSAVFEEVRARLPTVSQSTVTKALNDANKAGRLMKPARGCFRLPQDSVPAVMDKAPAMLELPSPELPPEDRVINLFLLAMQELEKLFRQRRDESARFDEVKRLLNGHGARQ